MRIAVLADIHANLVALRAAVAHVDDWRPDYVVIAGDLVNRGPRPLECLEFILERAHTHGWLLLRGNHEEYVMSHASPDAYTSGPKFAVHLPSYWTYQRLNCDIEPLQAMPLQHTLLDPAGKEVCFVHGSMLGLRDGIYPETNDRSLHAKIGLDRRPLDPQTWLCSASGTPTARSSAA